MKILIISPSLDPQKNVSGISSVVNTIISHGHNTYIHYTFGSTDQEIGKKNIKWAFRLLKSFINYRTFLKKQNIDLVHMNIPCNAKGILREYIILSINKACKKKNIGHLHGGEFLMKEPQNKLLLYCFKKILYTSDKIIVLSNIEKESLNTLYGYANAEVLHNSIDIDNTSYKFFDKNVEQKLQIIYLGRIHESKGIHDIIDAFSKLYKEKAFRFVLCGTGEIENHAVEAFRKIMKDDFTFKGIVSGNNKTDAIISSDIFILASRYGEGLPMALLETMGAGVIPIVTNDSSIKFVVKNNENGILIEKRNPNDIHLKLKDLLNNPDKLNSLSVNARKTIAENFDVKQMIKKLEQIYTDCLSS